jgi:YHS domain-containing protein
MLQKIMIKIVLVFFVSQACALQIPVLANKQGAIKGYDSVSYFNSRKGRRGSSEITYQWYGTNWRFKTEENKALFVDDPSKYAPQFGGYCATAMAKNAIVASDPKISVVYEGKLYLFYSKSAKDTWKRGKERNIVSGEKFWQQKNN